MPDRFCFFHKDEIAHRNMPSGRGLCKPCYEASEAKLAGAGIAVSASPGSETARSAKSTVSEASREETDRTALRIWCRAHLQRGYLVAADREIAGEPMCEACVKGVDLPTRAPSTQVAAALRASLPPITRPSPQLSDKIGQLTRRDIEKPPTQPAPRISPDTVEALYAAELDEVEGEENDEAEEIEARSRTNQTAEKGDDEVTKPNVIGEIDWEQVKRERASGVKVTELVQKYGVTDVTIYKYTRRAKKVSGGEISKARERRPHGNGGAETSHIPLNKAGAADRTANPRPEVSSNGTSAPSRGLAPGQPDLSGEATTVEVSVALLDAMWHSLSPQGKAGLLNKLG